MKCYSKNLLLNFIRIFYTMNIMIGVKMSRLTERIENFNKTYRLFDIAHKSYIENPQNEVNKLAIIQAFEIVYELGWKVIKDYLKTKAIEVYTPKDTIKTAFNSNILPSAQIWIDMALDRNASSHEYNEDKVSIILKNISTSYYEEITRFKNNLGDFND